MHTIHLGPTMSIDPFQGSSITGFAGEEIPHPLKVPIRRFFENKTITPKESTLSKSPDKPQQERLTSQITSRLHASLETPVILQTASELLGHALAASMCLIAEKSVAPEMLINHFYADPKMTSSKQALLQSIIKLCEKLPTSPSIAANSEWNIHAIISHQNLAQSNIHAIACKPVSYEDTVYGVMFVIQTDYPRIWQEDEITLLEWVAKETGVALHHAQEYSRIKEQLFSINLINSLTQQLTDFLDSPISLNSSRKLVESHTNPLSIRELEVLKLIAMGLANREIAQKLFLTESTVELHASRIRKKLKLKSRTALVKYACDNYLV